MKYQVSHSTTYRYSREVFLEPHLIRVCPRSDPGQRLISFDLTVTPPPAGISDGVDAEMNPFHLVWFNDLTERFQIEARFVVQTLKANPFDSFVISGDALPLKFTEDERRVLAPCLDWISPGTGGDKEVVGTLLHSIEQQCGATVFGFLNCLNNYLFETIDKVVRMDSGLQPVSETLETARGACRDTALVFMAVCRAAGIPARFVSGCQEGDPDCQEADLHGWAEVYLPGFGWKGYDPTHGLAVADRHIVYAASAVVGNASPVSGSFRGTGATAQMQHRISMQRMDT